MDNLKIIRKRRGMLQKDVAAYLGIGAPAYNHYESGRNQPDIETMKKLCDLFGVTMEELTGNDMKDGFFPDNNVLPGKTTLIPILGRVLAGYNGIAEQETIGYMEIEESLSKKFPDCFALKVSGKSMEPEIYDGDTVIVMPCNSVQSGSVAIVCINGDEGTIKRVKISDKGLTVIPTNMQYKPITYTPEQVEELPVRINGQVVQVRHNYF